ncbi:hypothetical protein GHT06_001583 [Daphnia sinensis]|uniref:Peptidase A2 domain-containing protein n=1 Tax=Daphnia sinensis TaxID=1820382 RepID=A0AAD5KVI1_9CRUS|nr:hypothetical protein GHT06_001583 [Daphnia sinensis]
MIDLTLNQSTSECEKETEICEEKLRDPPANPYFPYEIPLKINGLPVNMKVVSGHHDSFISKRNWKMMGKPKLAPVKYYGKASFGTAIRYEGQFIGEVQYGHRKFRLPLLVTSDSNSYLESLNSNMLGRKWLCCINLDWNKYFNPESIYLREETEDHRKLTQELESSCNSQPHIINVSMNSVPIQTMMMNPGRVHFQEETESMRKLALELKRSCFSQLFTIKVNIEGVSIEMVVDSGTGVSVIGRDVWKLLGKPKLEPTKHGLTDFSGRRVTMKRKCYVNVEYSGQKCVLPLLVLPRMKCTDSLALIGGNWFHLLRIDFNSLFKSIRYCGKKTKKPKGFQKYVEDRCRICKYVWAND